MAETPKLGHFDLLEELAHGGMGTIYRAFDPTLHREVAIKVLREQFAKDPKFLEEFLREARNAAAISHPHIVQIHFVGEQQGQYYIVMELLKGRTLRQIKEQDGPLAEERALDIAIQVAEGLRAAYKNQMIHGDIKPANIFITDDVGAKILDFGLAKLANVEVSSSGEIWGSPYYISPERVGQKAEDFRSDIYSLGATLFDALAGRPPFDAEKPEDLAVKRLSEKPPLLRSINPKITAKTEEVVNKMLNKSPLLRYRDYDHLLEDLREAKTAATAQRLGVSLEAVPTTLAAAPEAAASPAQNRRFLIIGTVVGAVVVGALAVVLLKQRPAAPPSPAPPPPPVTTNIVTATPTQQTPGLPPVAPPAPPDADVQRKIQQDKAAIDDALMAVNPLWPVYDFKGVLAKYDTVSARLLTAEGRAAFQPHLTTARLLNEFKQQLVADVNRQPYDRGDVQTRGGATLPGRITRATEDELTATMQYGATSVRWGDLAPGMLIRMAEYYGAVLAGLDSPALVARRQLRQAAFCHQYAMEDRAAFHATEALRLDASLRPEVLDVFGKIPTHEPPPAAPPVTPPTTATPKTPKPKTTKLKR